MAKDPVKNFAKCIVSGGYTSVATVITLQAGEGAKLPDPAVDGAFNMSFWNYTDYKDPSDDPSKELVRITARTNDVLTVVRAQEGTVASNKNTTDKVYYMTRSFTKNDYDKLLIAEDFHSATNKTTIVDDDEFGLFDSAASFILKKITWANIKTAFTSLLLTEVPANTDYTGITCVLTAGENLIAGDLVYFKSDGKVWKTDADAIATMPAMGMAMATISADATGVILLQGIYRNDALYALTVGGLLYASGTAGQVTQTQPAGVDGIIQVVGIATHADRIYFNPRSNYVSHI